MRELLLSLDSAAALRASIGGRGPDLPALATLAGLAGAAGVRVAVNEDGRPLADADLRDLRRAAEGLELRITPAPGLVKVALEVRPESVLLASEARDGSHKPVPLDFHAWGGALAPVVRTLEEAGIHVAVLVAADPDALKSAHAADAGGVELFTTRLVDLPARERGEALVQLGDVARLASKLRLRVGIGGGLDPRSIPAVLAAAPVADRVAVGRAFLGRSLLVGVDRATRDLREALA